MKLKALKTFSPRGAKLIRQGDVFTSTEADAEIYIRNGIAMLESGVEAPTESANKQDEILEPVTTGEEIYKEDDLIQKTISELKKIAKAKSVTHYSKMSKSEIIFAIVASQNGAQIQQMEE